MGGSLTKDEESPMSFEDTTPPREPSFPRRQLPFDPRSPTDNIARTPIIVDSVPSELTALDPRSPTYGIERTPLAFMLGKDCPAQNDTAVEGESKPQPVPPVSSAPLWQAEDTEMITPQKPTSSLDSKPVENDTPDVDAKDVSASLKNTEQRPASVTEITPNQPKMTSYPKKLFSTNQSAPVAPKQALVSRAVGLTARDTNSPRDIVQTKQRRQTAKSLGVVQGHTAVDKENMAH